MRFLVMLEKTKAGFAVQVPDLAIITSGESVEAAKEAARVAILVNLAAYSEVVLSVPKGLPAEQHQTNPDFKDLLFTFVEV
ncbi:MAG: type II toxin-antitoxin system HicB family antitoxin [Candidatus Hydrogenedentes bacterium]|nr:type II toxin-antitoxin system HicB family antitoxin [Candidatus Hydrogenedentota bacterium]